MARAQRKFLRRDNLILEMHEGGAKYRQIQEALDRHPEFLRISITRISEIVNKALEEEGQHRRAYGERIFDLKLNQLDATIRTNWGVINTKCRRCDGKGHLGQDPDRAPGVTVVCETCKGTAFQYHPRDRATASKEIRQAIDQQCKMLGLYAPEKFAITDPEGNELEFWAAETRSLDSDDLEKELDLYLAGVHAGRDELKQSREREETATQATGAEEELAESS